MLETRVHLAGLKPEAISSHLALGLTVGICVRYNVEGSNVHLFPLLSPYLG